jgi:hypothetical protein
LTGGVALTLASVSTAAVFAFVAVTEAATDTVVAVP